MPVLAAGVPSIPRTDADVKTNPNTKNGLSDVIVFAREDMDSRNPLKKIVCFNCSMKQNVFSMYSFGEDTFDNCFISQF